jgi:hypothetical protein
MIALRDKWGSECLALFTHGFGGSFFKQLRRA